VQSCPNGAIRITVVNRAEVQAEAVLPGATLVPGAPSSALTSPTTVYRSARPVPDDVRAADHFSLRPSHPHPPLAAMLVLTQLAVGMVAVDVARRASGAQVGWAAAAVASAIAVIALVASTLHLGRPRYAFRAVLGWRHSWLSREVIAFGLFTPLAVVHAGVAVADAPRAGVTGPLALVAGVAGVACSVLLYAVTGRAWWRARRSSATFGLSALATGSLATAAVDAITGGRAWIPLALVTAAATFVKLVWELSPFWARERAQNDVGRSALLLRRDLRGQFVARLVLGGAGGVAIPLALGFLTAGNPDGRVIAAAVIGTALLVAGELVERHLFFRVAVAPRMPGELR
jgi:DMSO reductase anchor subunit